MLYYEPPEVIVPAVMWNLSQIVGFQGSWSMEPWILLGQYNVIKLTYNKVNSGFGQDRLEFLANELPVDILLSGQNRQHFGSGVGGLTIWNQSVIVCKYDQTDCNGRGYYTYAPPEPPNTGKGPRIVHPLPIIIAHELAHAFHIATGTAPSNDVAAEVQATIDENTHRFQLGLPPHDIYFTGGGCNGHPSFKDIVKDIFSVFRP